MKLFLLVCIQQIGSNYQMREICFLSFVLFPLWSEEQNNYFNTILLMVTGLFYLAKSFFSLTYAARSCWAFNNRSEIWIPLLNTLSNNWGSHSLGYHQSWILFRKSAVPFLVDLLWFFYYSVILSPSHH